MLIGIDGNEANTKKRVGIGEFAFELIWQFSKLSSEQTSFSIYLKDDPIEALPKKQENWIYSILRPGKFWTQWRLPLDLYLRKPRPDVFFSPSHYAPRFSPIPTVISIMDLSYLFFPEMFNKKDLYQLVHWTKYSIEKAKSVITISQSTKNAIIEEYNIAKEKIHVVYPGIKNLNNLNPKIYTMRNIREKYDITEKYILFVGTLQPRKNIIRLIEAFAKIKHSSDEKLNLVIVGGKGWLYEEILEAPKKNSIEEDVKFLDYVSDEDLPILYKNALCYVLPSLYEGFGLPVLEAMKHDCPVITSATSSLPEAGGDAALYVDPLSVDDIASKIKMLLTDNNLRKELIAKGKKQVNKFSWEKSAKQILTILEDVARNHER